MLLVRAGALALAALAAVACGSAPPEQRAAAAAPAVPSRSPSPSPSPSAVQRGDGELAVVPGGSAPVGDGPLRTYVVEVEGGLGVDPAAFAREVDRTLADPRSWTSGGRRSLQRVDGDAGIRVALASPETVDRLCAPLDTVGTWSCANGERAVLNVARWLTGVAAYDGALGQYRQYLVNHEVAHVLGFGHADCPGPGEVAPVMLQQSLGLDGCARGPWPYP